MTRPVKAPPPSCTKLCCIITVWLGGERENKGGRGFQASVGPDKNHQGLLTLVSSVDTGCVEAIPFYSYDTVAAVVKVHF